MQRYLLISVFATVCFGQDFQVGAGGGFAPSRQLTVSGPDGTAKAGFRSGPAFSAWLLHHSYEHFSGELGYTFRKGDLQVTGAGSPGARFASLSHSVHYNVLVFATKRTSAVRPFLAGGGGGRYYIGTGTELPFQPLSNFAILTKTRELQAVATFGAGIEARLAKHVSLRVEVRDFASPVPTEVLTPAPGATLSGWIHDVTPMLSVLYRIRPKD